MPNKKNKETIKKNTMSRREFLKLSGNGAFILGSLALEPLLLSACIHTDRLIYGDERDYRSQVVILGGGASGLSAAYQLKKNKIPYAVFEASSRFGGRVLTLNHFALEDQGVDLGAEWFCPSQTALFALAKELRVSLYEVPEMKSAYRFIHKGVPLDFNQVNKGLNLGQKQLDKIFNLSSDPEEILDLISCNQLLTRLKGEVSPWFFIWMERYAQRFWGTDLDQVSALALYRKIKSHGSLGNSLWDLRWKVQGGTQVLTRALYDRCSGVLSDRFIKFNHRLVKIKHDGSRFILTFRVSSSASSSSVAAAGKGAGTETGTASVAADSSNSSLAFQMSSKKQEEQSRQREQTHEHERERDHEIYAENVICTLPLKAFKNIEGWEHLQFSEQKRKAIRDLAYGDLSKIAFAFPQRTWLKWLNKGLCMGDFSSQSFWEGGDSSRKYFQYSNSSSALPSKGVLISQIGGPDASQVGPEIENTFLKNLSEILKEPPSRALFYHAQNWSQLSLFKGSLSYSQPRQIKEWKKTLSEGEYQGRWLFAGEHCSEMHSGTLNGAIESGIKAAQSFVSMASLKK